MYQICWNLDIFSFEFMSAEVVDSCYETGFNFAQRHKKHDWVGFPTKEKKRLRKNGVVLVACTQWFWGNAGGSSLKCDTEVASLPGQVKHLVKDSSGCFVLFLESFEWNVNLTYFLKDIHNCHGYVLLQRHVYWEEWQFGSTMVWTVVLPSPWRVFPWILARASWRQ